MTYYGSKVICICIILLTCFDASKSVEYYTEKPSFIQTCKLYEPGFTKCSTSAMQKMMNQLTRNGIPELMAKFGVLDPMHIRNITFKQDNNAAATLHADLTEVAMAGMKDIIIKQNKINLKDLSYQTKVILPKLRLDGKYAMDGRILLLPLQGKGNFFIELENLNLTMISKSELYERDGYTFDNVTSVKITYMNIQRLKTYFDNLFNGTNKEIEHSTNVFFNENWRDFYSALRPLIIETIESILFDLLNAIFQLIPGKYFAEDMPTSEKFYGKKNDYYEKINNL